MTTFLYIEDNQAIRDLVRMILSRRPAIEMLEAETGAEGLALAAARIPDLVMIDITLPDMDGGAVLQHLREREATASVPAIAISGNELTETKASFPGFHAYLAKPVNIAALYQTIDDLLGSRDTP